jgi:serine/threonine-protein kinase
LIVGKYRLEKMLGEGGMGTVWLARNVVLDVPVALKLLRPDMQGEEAASRLLLEARVEAKLRHPNIVRVFDFAKTEFGDCFVVMEALDGLSMEEFMRVGRALSALEAVQVLLPVIDALAYAHECGVVHRDLKPGNIFLHRTGRRVRPKLLDFGVAKLSDDDSFRHRTHSGTLIGSPAYMAPEQARGEAQVDHRVDIWAICVVLYEAIAGHVAFPGEGYAILRAIVEDDLPPLFGDAGEATLWPIIARGIAKDRGARFASMRELGAALAQWLSAQGVTEDLAGNRLERSWPVRAPSHAQPRPVPEHDAGAEHSVWRVATQDHAPPPRPPARARGHVLHGAALALAMLAFAPSKTGREGAPLEHRGPTAVARGPHRDALTLNDASIVASRAMAELLRPLHAVSLAGANPQDATDPRSSIQPAETR